MPLCIFCSQYKHRSFICTYIESSRYIMYAYIPICVACSRIGLAKAIDTPCPADCRPFKQAGPECAQFSGDRTQQCRVSSFSPQPEAAWVAGIVISGCCSTAFGSKTAVRSPCRRSDRLHAWTTTMMTRRSQRHHRHTDRQGSRMRSFCRNGTTSTTRLSEQSSTSRGGSSRTSELAQIRHRSVVGFGFFRLV